MSDHPVHGLRQIYGLFASPLMEAERRREAERWRRAEQEERRLLALSLQEQQAAQTNQRLALELLQAQPGRRLRWTQIRARLDQASVQGVRTFLKSHPEVEHRKSGKHDLFSWRQQ